MTTPWLYDENSQFYTKICDFWLLRTWFMAQDDSALKRTKKKWSVQHDAEKDVATIEKLANYLGASCFFTCWHSNTADGIGEPQSPRVYIYIQTYIHKYIYTYEKTKIFTFIFTCIFTCICKDTDIYWHKYTYGKYIYIYVHIFTYAYMYVRLNI